MLNIGVGKGYCTRALHESRARVHALDISPAALQRVRPFVEAAWLPSQLSGLPESFFDVAISFLVAQHMADADLEDQIRAVVRSLKPDGVFAIQFACSPDPGYQPPAQTPDLQKAGSICRTHDRMEAIVASCGGTVARASQIGSFPEHKSAWYCFHIRRDRSPL